MTRLLDYFTKSRDRDQSDDASDKLVELEDYLVAIAGKILQKSDQKARAALGAATNVIAGSAFYASIMGGISAVGTASTGAAIGGLFGAAKTSASLFWLGGFVGGGAVAGGAILAVGGVAAGIYGSNKVRRALFGSERDIAEMSEEETRILGAILALKNAIDAQKTLDRQASIEEVAVFFKIGIVPVVDELVAILDRGGCPNLTVYNRMRLRGHLNNLRALEKRLVQS